VICSNCGTDNEPGLRFCDECGTSLAAGCPACGAANRPGARFCGSCGASLATAGRLEGRAGNDRVAPPVAERRVVSVLFADLVGFTSIAEGRDAEDTRELLSRYFELARDVIGRYGGTPEKFIGDAVMAVWGAPVAREDDAELAVRAALDLVDAVKGLGPAMGARAAVMTGEAAVTVGAVGQGMVAGDLVNSASRLQSVAPPGTVLVGEATHRAASRAIAFEPLGPQTLRGMAASLEAWRAMRIVAEVGGRNRSETLEAPFVGRDDELRLLKDLFHATRREGRARLVSVIGPAGIGKTRLAWEFSKYVDGLIEDVWFHEGRSPAYGDGVTFWALGEMVRRRAGLGEGDDEPTTRARISEMVAERVADESERRWIESAFLVLLGVESGLASEQLFGAWRLFFERLAATAPVVLVFEDFHYADTGLVDFVDQLLDLSRGLPLYVVTLARPEFLERRPDWSAGKRSFTSLFLEPLPPEAMHELLAGLVPGLPGAAADAIVSRADGIPLYAVEMVRMLLAEGRLVQDGERFRPTGDLATLAIPETLTALIASRLDALPADERAVVSDAAVLGQTFTVAGLAAVAGRSPDELAAPLRSLARRELLRLDTDPQSPERGQYGFVQALIREVAYNTLARAERRSRHVAAARYVESLDTEETAGALAGHYMAAYRNSPEGPEADAAAAQARVALRAAAERAAALGAFDQSLRFLNQALEITADPGDRSDLEEQAGRAAAAAGRYEEAERHLRSAIEISRELGDRSATARVTAALCQVLTTARHADLALPLLESADAEFSDLPDDPGVIAIGAALARALWLSSEGERSLEVAERFLPRAERFDLFEELADLLITKGSALDWQGRSVEGAALIRAAQEIAEARGLSSGILLRAIGNRVGLLMLVRPREAVEVGRAGIDLARRLGQRQFLSYLVTNTALAASFIDEWDWAAGQLEIALVEEWESSDRVELLDFLIMFRTYRGLPIDDAHAEAERLLEGVTDTIRLSTLADIRGYVAFGNGRLLEAHDAWVRWGDLIKTDALLPWAIRPAIWARDLALVREDLARYDASAEHGPLVEAHKTTIRAAIAAVEGRDSDASRGYAEALRRWREMDQPFHEAMTTIDMATLLDPADPAVVTAAARARDYFGRTRADWLLARLDAALAREASAGADVTASRPQPATPA